MHRVRRTKNISSPRKGNIKRCHCNTVVEGCFNDDLELVLSPEDAYGLKSNQNYCERVLFIMHIEKCKLLDLGEKKEEIVRVLEARHKCFVSTYPDIK